jgi:hypothetical protein
MFGWRDDAMPSLYTRSADTARLAREAASKPGKNESRKSISSPDEKVRESAPKQ